MKADVRLLRIGWFDRTEKDSDEDLEVGGDMVQLFAVIFGAERKSGNTYNGPLTDFLDGNVVYK